MAPTGRPAKYVWMRGDQKKYGGDAVDRGQIILLRGLPNDGALLSSGYLVKLSEIAGGKEDDAKCVRCGAEFYTEGYLRNHQTWCQTEAVELKGVSPVSAELEAALPAPV